MNDTPSRTIRILRPLVALFVVSASVGKAAAQQPVARGLISEFGAIGSGPDTVLILPCMSCRWTAWEAFMRAHGDRFTFIAITPPGFGGSPAPELSTASDSDSPWRRNLLNALSIFIDQQRIRRAIILGHSWGTMISVQLAERRPDVARGIMAVDGALESTTWLPADRATRVSSASSLQRRYASLDSSAEAWSAFNRFQLPPDSTIPRTTVRELLLLHGAFMATPRRVLFGYWRENFLVDITRVTRALTIPILDVKCLWPGLNADSVRSAHLESLEQTRIATRVKTVFMDNTVHHVMIHRPSELGRILGDFAGTLPR